MGSNNQTSSRVIVGSSIFHSNNWDPVTNVTVQDEVTVIDLGDSEEQVDGIGEDCFQTELPLSLKEIDEEETEYEEPENYVENFGALKFCDQSKKSCFKHFNWESTLRAALDIQRARCYLKIEELEARENRLRVQEHTRYDMFNILTHS